MEPDRENVALENNTNEPNRNTSDVVMAENPIESSNENVEIKSIVMGETDDTDSVKAIPADATQEDEEILDDNIEDEFTIKIGDAANDENENLESISNAITQERIRVINALNGTPSAIKHQHTTNAKKRKSTTLSISLLCFVNILYDIYKNMTFDRTTKQMRFKRNIQAYIDENIDIECKRIKLNENDPSSQNGIANYSQEFKQRALNCILNKVFNYMESQNMQFLFPKEMLRFFMATSSEFITFKDFISTSAIPKSERKSKNSTPLNNGGILQEYVKGFDVFTANMPRSDHNDIKALKLIRENNMSIPSNIYDIVTDIEFTPPEYFTDSEIKTRQDYAQVLISSSKILSILLTSDIVMYYDGNQFAVPQPNIEREFTMEQRQSTKLKPGDYIILEVLASTKIKVLDILKYRLGAEDKLPTKYTDRLELARKILPNINVVSITNKNETPGIEYSYIQKPVEGYGPSYVYHKSNLIAAAVGYSDKTVSLAFLEDDNTLAIKSKVSISGPVTCHISIMAHKSKTSKSIGGSDINFNGQVYKVVGDLNDLTLFTDAIAVELKDGNRLGALSSSKISKVIEYKPVTVKRENAVLMKDIEKRLDNVEFVTDLIRNISKVPITMTEDQKRMLLSLIQPNTSVSFDGYDSLE